MYIARKSMLNGKVRTLDVPVTPEQLKAYEDGVDVEKAFPRLSLAFREFIMSGLTRSDWIEAFGEKDEGYGRTVKELEVAFK